MPKIPDIEPSPLQKLDHDLLPRDDVEVWVKRDDLIHPRISGNKWRKLKYNIAALEPGAHVLTFGGAWSNHVRAVAAAGAEFGFRATAIIRGELVEPMNPVLSFAREQGVCLVPVSRSEYRLRHDAEWVEQQRGATGTDVVWPEGGSNALALKGVNEIMAEIEQQHTDPFDMVCVPVGTGGTLAGIVSALPETSRALGVCVLKGGEFLRDEVRSQIAQAGEHDGGSWDLETEYHFGGYAKMPPDLIRWVEDFTARSDIPLEPVYSGKLFYAVMDKLASGWLSPGGRILVVHTGGV